MATHYGGRAGRRVGLEARPTPLRTAGFRPPNQTGKPDPARRDGCQRLGSWDLRTCFMRQEVRLDRHLVRGRPGGLWHFRDVANRFHGDGVPVASQVSHPGHLHRTPRDAHARRPEVQRARSRSAPLSRTPGSSPRPIHLAGAEHAGGGLTLEFACPVLGWSRRRSVIGSEARTGPSPAGRAPDPPDAPSRPPNCHPRVAIPGPTRPSSSPEVQRVETEGSTAQPELPRPLPAPFAGSVPAPHMARLRALYSRRRTGYGLHADGHRGPVSRRQPRELRARTLTWRSPYSRMGPNAPDRGVKTGGPLGSPAGAMASMGPMGPRRHDAGHLRPPCACRSRSPTP